MENCIYNIGGFCWRKNRSCRHTGEKERCKEAEEDRIKRPARKTEQEYLLIIGRIYRNTPAAYWAGGITQEQAVKIRSMCISMAKHRKEKRHGYRKKRN